MRKKDKILKITYGLAGSGKTLYSRNTYESGKDSYGYACRWMMFDTDNILYNVNFKKSKKARLKLLSDNFRSYTSDNRNLIVDGLITTNKGLITFLKSVSITSLKKYSKIIIVEFDEDRDACLWNNIGRDKNADVSIKLMDFEKVDLVKLEDTFTDLKFEIENVKVARKEVIKRYMNDYASTLSYIDSDTYTTGGTWENCWETGGTYDSEDRGEADFSNLKELLTKLKVADVNTVFGEIIWDDSLVTIEDGDESDYYGGCRDYSWMRINLTGLEEWLRDRGLIREAVLSEILD